MDFIESEVTARWHEIANEDAGAVSIGVGPLTALHPALQRHALRRAYAVVAGDARSLGEIHLEAMLSLLHNRRGGRSLDLPRGVRARLQGDRLQVDRYSEPTLLPELIGEYSIRLPVNPGELSEANLEGWRIHMESLEPGQQGTKRFSNVTEFTARLNREALGTVASVRTRRPGDRFQPLGMTGTKKLQDFFTDAKIPRQQRDSISLLVCDRGIAWVVGHRVADWAAAKGRCKGDLYSL